MHATSPVCHPTGRRRQTAQCRTQGAIDKARRSMMPSRPSKSVGSSRASRAAAEPASSPPSSAVAKVTAARPKSESGVRSTAVASGRPSARAAGIANRSRRLGESFRDCVPLITASNAVRAAESSPSRCSARPRRYRTSRSSGSYGRPCPRCSGHSSARRRWSRARTLSPLSRASSPASAPAHATGGFRLSSRTGARAWNPGFRSLPPPDRDG